MKNKTCLLLLGLLLPAGCAGPATLRVRLRAPVPGSGSLELSATARPRGPLIAFEPNDGQFADPVRYAAHPKGFRVWLTDDRVVLSPDEGGAAAFALRPFAGCHPPHPEDAIHCPIDRVRSVKPRHGRLLQPLYRRVRYPGIVPGIDLEASGADGLLELAYHVSPGANPASLSIGVDGRSVDLQPDGSLLLTQGSARNRLDAPAAWQPGVDGPMRVPVKWVIHADGTVGFEVGAFDHTKELVIQ